MASNCTGSSVIAPRFDVIVNGMAPDEINLAAMAETLAKSADYRVLRRLLPRAEFASCDGQATKTGILLDVETTGLDAGRDEVIELAMVKFTYLPDGRIARIVDVFSSFNEPSNPIPAEITDLTEITDEMVAGHRIDPDVVTAFVEDSVIVIAHNANFDRKFAERYWPVFEQKSWGCSATEVEWRKHGFDGSRLGYLLAGVGFFHRAHRAIDDCHALIEILVSELPKVNKPALAVLLERARRKTIRIWAEQSPFDLKDELKKRGYRWNDGVDGRPRSWYIDVDEASEANEIEFLRTTIYLRDVEPRIQAMSAINRFSNRALFRRSNVMKYPVPSSLCRPIWARSDTIVLEGEILSLLYAGNVYGPLAICLVGPSRKRMNAGNSGARYVRSDETF